MRTGFTPWTDVVLAQALPYQRVAAFVLVSIEREHRLNLEALSAYWIRAVMSWPSPLPLRGGRPLATPAEQTESSPAHVATSQGSKQ